MGTRMAPSYANLFMSHLESLLLEHPPGNLLPLVWKRYIDDIFILWTHGSSTLQTFLNHINAFHPTIKFTYTTSPSSINFLDTRIHITPQQTLESSLYTKPTDNSLLLHQTSHHPLSCKLLGTIFSQALRYRRLITQDEELHKQLNRLRLILLSRGYPNYTITSSFQKGSIEDNIMFGQPIIYKELCSIATQTDDYGCSNGCTSMYIDTGLTDNNMDDASQPHPTVVALANRSVGLLAVIRVIRGLIHATSNLGSTESRKLASMLGVQATYVHTGNYVTYS
ncbi:hypothetical protein QZH41_007939 [Actinostola sp. cb2023]|nr:hypothetical protein QZH41_007939 [Actinostola sp. cb2023]